ncbi:MAG TPA: EpsG family protein [Clostridiales bacterium]|mgnify:CR=1 FL=1|nr:MAG: Transmembrane protein EpsG [Firmicutes bacterium ADurb.Bin262]HOU09750.1 EpsG family protein [Clostridiales bacterium]HQH62310.1 EpsG family protein [Clostridiales bacterium]HQK72541.1 EpsG family protein [Clostridiales bacterium]
MFFFWLFLLISYLAALAARHYPIRSKGGLGQPLPNPMGYIVPAVLLTVFAGLRNSIGDTYFYMHSYRLMGILGKPEIHFSGHESFFDFFQNILFDITKDPQMLIFITAAVSCIPAIFIIYKYTKLYEMGILLFVLTAYYSNSFNGIKQYVAAGVILLGTRYLFGEERWDWLKFMLFVLVAYKIHSTAIVMIPLYFLVRQRAWSLISMLTIVGSIFLLLAMDIVIPNMMGIIENSPYSEYSRIGWFTSGIASGSNIFRLPFVALPVVLSFFSLDKLRYLGKKGDAVINLSILNLAFYIISLYNWIFARFAIYTSIFMILLICWLIEDTFRKKDRPVAYAIAVAVYSVYFYTQYFTVQSYTSNYLKDVF